MLTFEQIKDLIDQVASHRLSGLELERSGFRLRIDGQKISEPGTGGTVHLSVPAASAGEAAPPLTATGAPPPAADTAGQGEAPPSEAPPVASDDTHVLTSPIVGTYYASPNPDSAPYIVIGDRVRKGQVLCIVEAMKLMNEIESDVDGVITKIYPKNAQPVEYGEPLFAIEMR